MFYLFLVDEDYWDYLCFMWYRDNDIERLFIIYWIKVYVFGNCFFLFVVMYGLCCIGDLVVESYG